MGFPVQRYSGYEPINWRNIYSGQWCTDEEVSQMVNNTLFVYSHSRRNIDSTVGYGPDDGATEDVDHTVEPAIGSELFQLPLQHMITGAGKRLRVWVYCKRDDGSSSSYLIAILGREVVRVDLSAATGVWEMVPITIRIDPVTNPSLLTEDVLTIYAGVDWDYGDGNQVVITVRSISAHELPGENIPDWTDTSGGTNKIGIVDYPYSAAMRKMVVKNIATVYGYRLPRCNVFNRCYKIDEFTLTTSYGSSYNDMGDWVIRKPQGTTQINSIVRCVTDVDVATIRLSLWSIDSIDYDGQTSNFTEGTIVRGTTSGAKAVILKDNDSGTTGTLLLGLVEASNIIYSGFANNEPIVDSEGGSALVNGTQQGPQEIAYQEVSISTSNAYKDIQFTGLVSTDAEYWVRLDAKKSGVSTATNANLNFIHMSEELGSAITYKLPNPSNTEQDDDVVSKTFKNVKNTLEHIWARQKQTILSDYRHYDDENRDGMDTDYLLGILNRGLVYMSENTEAIILDAWVFRPGLDTTRRQQYTTPKTGTPADGDKVTGVNSKKYGWFLTSTLSDIYVEGIVGAYENGEVLNFTPSGATVTAVNGPEKIDSDIYLGFRVFNSSWDPPITIEEIDCKGLEHGKVVKIRAKISISDTFANDRDTTYPFLFEIGTKSSEPGDRLIFMKSKVYEEPLYPGTIAMTQEDVDR